MRILSKTGIPAFFFLGFPSRLAPLRGLHCLRLYWSLDERDAMPERHQTTPFDGPNLDHVSNRMPLPRLLIHAGSDTSKFHPQPPVTFFQILSISFTALMAPMYC